MGPAKASTPGNGRPTPTAHLPPRFSAPAGWRLLYLHPGFSSANAVDLRAVGDIMLARDVEPVLRAHPPGWLFEPTGDLLGGDVVVGNLESPFTGRRRAEQLRPGPYRLPADPVLALAVALFTALSLANNHALDAGAAGLTDAIATVAALGVTPLGVRGPGCPPTRSTALPVTLPAYNAVVDPEDQPA